MSNSISVIPPSLPPGSCDQRPEKSEVKMPYNMPKRIVVTKQSEPGTRYVFENYSSIMKFYLRICSDDREHMLNAAVRDADQTYFYDKNATALSSLLPEAHIGTHKIRDKEKEEFTIFYK